LADGPVERSAVDVAAALHQRRHELTVPLQPPLPTRRVPCPRYPACYPPAP
jgi:hypothetical protein